MSPQAALGEDFHLRLKCTYLGALNTKSLIKVIEINIANFIVGLKERRVDSEINKSELKKIDEVINSMQKILNFDCKTTE